jgi:Mg/Co/Ni transporter MgtE
MEEKALQIAEKLESLAPHVWEVLVRQQYVEAIILLVATLIACVVAFFVFRAEHAGNAKGDWEPGVWVFISVLAVSLFAGLLFGGIPRLLNPEYYAIMELVPGR